MNTEIRQDNPVDFFQLITKGGVVKMNKTQRSKRMKVLLEIAHLQFRTLFTVVPFFLELFTTFLFATAH